MFVICCTIFGVAFQLCCVPLIWLWEYNPMWMNEIDIQFKINVFFCFFNHCRTCKHQSNICSINWYYSSAFEILVTVRSKSVQKWNHKTVFKMNGFVIQKRDAFEYCMDSIIKFFHCDMCVCVFLWNSRAHYKVLVRVPVTFSWCDRLLRRWKLRETIIIFAKISRTNY